jgi:glycerol-3-phosphate dehydrogenase
MWVREKQVSQHPSSFDCRGDLSLILQNLNQVNGEALTKVINRTHLNARYLPDIKLPSNLVAVGSLKKVVEGATLIVFVVPHQLSVARLRC